MNSTSQSSDSCSRSSISRCSVTTDCYSMSPLPATKVASSSPEDLLHGHLHLTTQHLQHSASLRDNVFGRQIYRPQQHVSPPVATPPNNNANGASNNVSMRALKFSIDNILKPDFGRQTTPLYNIPSLKKGSSGGALSERSSNCAGLHDVSVGRTSTSKRISVGGSGNGNHGVSAEKVAAKNRSNGGALPMDLSKVVAPIGSSCERRDSSSAASEGSAAAVSPPAATVTGVSTSGNLPSSSQLLWPAWVYCTRYSDRPSSGKLQLCLSEIETKLFACERALGCRHADRHNVLRFCVRLTNDELRNDK
jgi:hypothetical protein